MNTSSLRRNMINMTKMLILLGALSSSLINAQSDTTAPPPANDLCTDAIEITTLPFVDETGTVAGATQDDWSIDCGFSQVRPGNGVWYKITGQPANRSLNALCGGVDCMLMTPIDGVVEECGEDANFVCAPQSAVGRREGNVLSYSWTTTETNQLYYLYFAPEDPFVGPNFTLRVEDVTTTAPTQSPTTMNPNDNDDNGGGGGTDSSAATAQNGFLLSFPIALLLVTASFGARLWN